MNELRAEYADRARNAMAPSMFLLYQCKSTCNTSLKRLSLLHYILLEEEQWT